MEGQAAWISSPLLQGADVGPEIARYCVQKQDHGLADVLDNTLIELCKPALETARGSRWICRLRNVNRTVGTMLSSRVAKSYGLEGLPPDTIR